MARQEWTEQHWTSPWPQVFQRAGGVPKGERLKTESSPANIRVYVVTNDMNNEEKRLIVELQPICDRKVGWAMFRDACKVAAGFTLPIILSRRTVGGKCSSGLAACVVVNKDGWIVTASHVVDQFDQMSKEVQQVDNYKKRKLELDDKSHSSLSHTEHKRQLRQLGKLPENLTQNYSIWIGHDALTFDEALCFPMADIAVAKLKGFNSDVIREYPKFKDPKKDYVVGASVCRIGFPFFVIEPTWNEAEAKFVLPAGVVPVPLFAIDGILSRMIQVVPTGGQAPAFPVLAFETSTPGLRGQSGGPIFDNRGAIWGIQSRTNHYSLGFDPKINGRVEHQFLNVGVGTHVDTLINFFRENGVSFQLSSH